MAAFRLETPVVFIIFRRPETTRRVFEAIRAVRPSRLLVIADGPRTPEDAELVVQTRAIIDGVDWECTVLRNYAEANMGLKRRISSGLDWVFEQVEEAIILEDDCLPHPTFFRFCEELLARYRDEPRVMHISGNNYQPESHRRALQASYYFTRYPHVWGWATWRRAWLLNDVVLTCWQSLPDKDAFLRRFEHRRERAFWRWAWDAVAEGRLDTWDYGWAFTCMVHNGLAINPGVNLVDNIGCGAEATHTRRRQDCREDFPAGPITFPLIAPADMIRDAEADARIARMTFMLPTLPQRILRKLKRMVREALNRG